MFLLLLFPSVLGLRPVLSSVPPQSGARLSLHLFLGLPMLRFPMGDLSLAILINLSHAIQLMCSFHCFFHCNTHLFMSFILHNRLMLLLLFLSSSVFPEIRRNIFISVVSRGLYVFIVSGLVSDVYVIIGLIVANVRRQRFDRIHVF